MKDLKGQKIGKLRIIELSNQKKNGKKLWKCLCDCQLNKPIEEQKFYYASTSDLMKKAKVKSCGCYNRERCLKHNQENKKTNNYNLSGNFGIGYTFKDEEFFFDLEDYNKIKKYNWIIVRGYVLRTGDNMPMHRVILNLEHIPYNDVRVDHIKGNTTDNRKSELRIVTPSQNSMNSRPHKNNTSTVTGVSWSKSHKKWIARIGINNKRITLGEFDNFDEAVKARKEGEEKYYKEYSFDNSRT